MTTEAQEQKALIERAKYHWILKHHMWSTPNDGKRSFKSGKNMVDTGLKKGVADLFIAYPVLPYHGMFIELKRLFPYKGRLTEEQREFLERQASVGYAATVAYGQDQAWAVMMQYLDGKFEQKFNLKR